jgi:AmiR/NasT family two-component response regulator
MEAELDTARASLLERKVIERAKGLLMAHRRLSEDEAHKLMRDTAMQQGKKMLDVAQAILSMAHVLPLSSPASA